MMAATRLTLTIDTSIVQDAIADLEAIHRLLPKRHGDVYREIDRDIERLLDDGISNCLAMHVLPEGVILAAPTGPLTEIFRKARKLDLI